MPGDRDIRARIKSISDTRQLTNAMKIVSAAKLRQARNQLERTRPYFNRIETTIADILSHDIYKENIYFDRREDKTERRNAYILLTGDKGLCGGYNSNIFKYAERYLRRDKDPLLLICGHTGAEYFAGKGYRMDPDFFYPVYNPSVIRAREIQEYVMELFREGRADSVFLVYTMLKSSFTLVPHIMRLLPLRFETLRRELGIKKILENRYEGKLIYEPSMAEVFDVLIPKYLKGIIYSALVEAFTSEQCARMTAMESATSNADDMIAKLKLVYNKTRQDSITREITEIISGVEVMEA